MKSEYLKAALFLIFTAAFFYLFYLIMAPFFAPLCWAAVLTIIFYPLYTRICKNKLFRLPQWLASVIVVIIVILVIIGPIAYLFVALVNEVTTAVAKVNEMYKNGELDSLFSYNVPWFETLRNKLAKYYDLSQINLDQLAKDAINRVSGLVLNQTSWLVTNGTKAGFYFILMLFSMYYFFIDGRRLVAKVKRLVPFAEPSQVESIFSQLHRITHATIFGGAVVALLQGFIGGILFAAVGIGSPVFWGALMAFLAIIPFVGAPIIYIPAGVILMLGGSYVQGIIVLAVGGVIISQIDNVVRPLLISKGAQIHPLLLFFSIMGGIGLFGILGLVVGPLIAAVFMTLLHILDFRLNPVDEESSSAPEPD